MIQYLSLLEDILKNGNLKKTRAGDTLSTFAKNLHHNMSEGFPILTTKKIDFKNIVIEMLWFLSGDSKWDFLHKHGITFWDAWDEGKGQLPRAYGEHWRKYPDRSTFEDCISPLNVHSAYIEYYHYFDQFKAIINSLKKDPDNRRLVLDRWYAPDAWKAKLPPCFLTSIFNVQYHNTVPYLCLHNLGRSVDVPIGLPFNIAGFGLLLELVSHLTNIPVGTLAFSMTDCHIYINQISALEEQLNRKPAKLPKLIISKEIKTLEDIDQLIKDGTTEQIMNCFKLDDYNPQPFIKFPVTV